MHKVIVVGDRDSIYGFSFGGVETRFVNQSDNVSAIIDELAKDQYAVIYLTENLYNEIRDDLYKYEEMPATTVVPIPGVTGNTGIGIAEVKKFVERAIGSDILFGNMK